MSTALLQTTYFGPLQWYQKLYRYDHCLIEQYDTYQKQTYRNRCIIATANGLQALTVPVEHETLNIKHETLKVKDLRISDHNNWRRIHWNALQSAYSESPFFDYYADDIHPFFEKKYEFLIDFNEAIRQKVCELLDIHPDVSYTSDFRHQTSPTSAKSSMPNIHNQTRTSRLNAIGRSLRESTAFKPISRYSTSSLTWAQNLFFIYKPYLFILNSKTV